MAGSSTAEPAQPAFYFDLGSPEAYLAAERVLQVLPVTAEWIPIVARELPGSESWDAFRCCDEQAITLARIERTAAERGLQPVRWPDPFPFDSALAMRVATYAKQTGRTVAFAQAAFRQAFAGGRDLSVQENVLIAASACEMHPVAILKAVELRSIGERLTAATALARERGVRDAPAVWLPSGEVFHGDHGVDEAAAALAALVAR
jgi:2-hydroxychromene-2-carboxylate isomerase